MKNVIVNTMSMMAFVFVLFGCSSEEVNRAGEAEEQSESAHDHSEAAHDAFASVPEEVNEQATANLLHSQMKNTTRLAADDPVEFSVWVSQLIWPATHEQNRPGAVILVPVENWGIALASTTLIHHPNDGPVLFTKNGELPAEVLQEIERLQPKGNVNGTEIMIMGDVEEELFTALGNYTVEQIKGKEPVKFASDVEQYFSDLVGEVNNSVLIASVDEDAQAFSVIAGHWIAHMNESLLYVKDDVIPEATAEALAMRDGQATIYVLGSEAVISEQLFTELEEFGAVQRIAGTTPAEMSIAFATFRDQETQVGWGQTEPGHGWTFAAVDTPLLAIAGAPLGHLGKHTPLIWIDGEDLSEDLYEYLATVRPTFADNPMAGPYNHAYILGTSQSISHQLQGIIDEKLEISGEHGGH
ncbi:hypothetical protein SAMN05421736_107154 [Evansella caseinilytica]|uniref:ArsR family transcriptional regulator n=1 Tax=Evansella caseinilytica TaxID=1503961 RepID=A0A1H3R1G4_9BACI|nr:hypothetical protein [Evansella caseinilytica]SDZ19654.1 hypothetical protein SAMN05421736_107154 [Evansella caseinilytica]